MKVLMPIQPMPAPRPRVTRYGTYNDPKYTNYKKAIALLAKQKFELSDNPIAMNINFYFEKPKSWSKKKRDIAYWHTSRPDIDNLQKGVKDALNGIAYKDDSQVCYVMATKCYADTFGIEIEIHDLNVNLKEL